MRFERPGINIGRRYWTTREGHNRLGRDDITQHDERCKHAYDSRETPHDPPRRPSIDVAIIIRRRHLSTTGTQACGPIKTYVIVYLRVVGKAD
jgi:hypothetical protein